MGRKKKVDEFSVVDEILNSMEEEKSTKPKKHIKIDEQRFHEERGRVIKYLEGIPEKKVGTFEAISILEDLGVILDTNGLPKEDIISQLEEELRKPYRRL